MAFHPLYIKHQIFSWVTEFSFCYRPHSWSSLCQSWWPVFSYSPLSSLFLLPLPPSLMLAQWFSSPRVEPHCHGGHGFRKAESTDLGPLSSQMSLSLNWNVTASEVFLITWCVRATLSSCTARLQVTVASLPTASVFFSVFPTADRPSQFNESRNSFCYVCHSLCVQCTVGHSVSIYGIHRSISNSLPAKQT